jgi:hypothetical protein
MLPQKDPNAQTLVEFTVPYKGTWPSLAANQLKPDSLYNSNNVYIREGKIRSRPGLTLLKPTKFNGRVLGGGLAVSATRKTLLAFTKSAAYSLVKENPEWQVSSIATIASSDDSIVDITFLETASEYVGVIANGETAIQAWTEVGGVEAIVPTEGTLPVASSVCTAARRIVALVKPHTLRWTSTLTYDNWSDLNYNKVSDNNDIGIAVRSLSKNSFVLYKERSIYLAKAQAGSNAIAFSLSEPITVEGPAGIHAIVKAEDTHFYMTPSGRIAMFDGSRRPQWIADGIWLRLQRDIDPEYTNRIIGIYDYRLHLVIFFYPVNGDNGDLHGIVLINLPLEGSGITTHTPFLGETSRPVSFGYEMRFNNEASRSVVFTTTIDDRKSFILDEDGKRDDNVIFNSLIHTPLAALPDSKHHRLTAEVFLERGTGYGSLDLYGIRSSVLDTPGGTIDNTEVHRVNLEFPVETEHFPFIHQSRFFGLSLQWQSTSTVHYAGAVVSGRQV